MKNIVFEQLDMNFEIEKEIKEEIEKENSKVVDNASKKKRKNNKKKKESLNNSKINNENSKDSTQNNDENLDVDNNVPLPQVDIHTKKEVVHLSESNPSISNKNSFLNLVNKVENEKKEQLQNEIASLNKDLPYIASSIMTNAEKQLFHFMNKNLLLKERILIFPKVRLGDIVRLDERISNNQKDYYKVACKHVDYVIVDRETLELICAVELDDYTHDRDEVKERDMFVYYVLNNAGIKLERIKTRIADISKADLYDIETIICDWFRPKCSWCGADTIVKVIKKSGNIRHRFYSCTRFPDCRWSLDYDS